MAKKREKKNSTVLYCAARYLEKHGVLRGRFAERYVPDANGSWGPCCAWGAINVCAYGDPRSDGVVPGAVAALEKRVGGPYPRGIAAWNDDPFRPDSEIISTIREVARAEKKEGR